MKVKVLGWAKRNFLFPLVKIIREGISIERLSVSLALGITVGLIPLYGLTTVIISCIALSLRLNLIAMQIAHYIVHPIQLALLIPFLKMGDALIKTSEASFTLQNYLQLFRNDFWSALHDLWLVNLSAVGVWFLVSIPLYLILYFGIIYLLKKYNFRLKFLHL
jgi:uncharacterized protein (DUF2062 family)